MGNNILSDRVSLTSKILPIQRGLFVIRYTAAVDRQWPPKVMITAMPGFGQDVQFLWSPEGEDGMLSGPGTAVALRVAADVKLNVTLAADEYCTSTEVTLETERLDQEGGFTAAPRPRSAAAMSSSVPEVRPTHAMASAEIACDVLAHVSRRGDVRAQAGEWIGDEQSPLAVEGVAVKLLSAPPGLGIGYAAHSRGVARPNTGRDGSFAGTRGKALPLTGVDFGLNGGVAPEFEVVASVAFSDGRVLDKRGAKVSFSSHSDDVVVTGIRVSVGAVRAGASASPYGGSESASSARSQVRVFRAQGR